MIKKAAWILIGFLPFVLLGLTAQSNYVPFSNSLAWVGGVFIVLGVFVASLNFYLSFLRIPIHRKLYPNEPDPKFISGIPIVGVIALFGVMLVNRSLPLILIVLISLLLDTGGIQWFVIAIWKDKSFWSKEGD